jgi:hypothetical protein
MVTATIVPSCCRSKSRTRPSYRLCCWRWNFLVRPLNSAAQAAEHYCAEEAMKSRSASREEQQQCAAARRPLASNWWPQSVHFQRASRCSSRQMKPPKTEPRTNWYSRSGARADRKQSWNDYRQTRREFRTCPRRPILKREPAARRPQCRRSSFRAAQTSALPIFVRARQG